MLKAWAHKNGFTIVELLVSIVVIAVIASIIIVSYRGIEKTSRDSERTSDITLIKIALEKYQAEKSVYPSVCPGGDNVGCNVTNLATALKPYLDVIPQDPVYAGVTNFSDYQYIRRQPSVANGYGLLINYESKPVCKTGVNTSDSWWGVGVPYC